MEYPDFRRAGRLLLRLEAAGIDLASLTDVVLTHMHMDHIGGLLGDGVKGRLRPDLRIHVSAAEAEFWAAGADLSRASMPPGIPDALRSVAKRFLDEYRSLLRPFETEYEVAPGVVVCRTGGHTPGHSVVRLESGGDRLMFGGDAVFLARVRLPRVAQRLRHRARGDGPRPGRSLAGAGGDPPAACAPLTCRSRPSAGWRSPATSFVGYRPSGRPDCLLG